MKQLAAAVQGFWALVRLSQLWRKGLVVSVVLVMLVTSLSGCSPMQLRVGAARMPTLVMSSLSDPKTFNTVTSQEASDVFPRIEQGLIDQDGITGEIIPALAESWEFSPDKLGITFTLRPNLKWSDGQPLTVDDVIFTYQDIYLNEKIPTDARDTLRIGKERKLPTVRKLDERRVEFRIPEPFAPFLRITGIGIMPKHILEDSVKALDEKGNPEFLSTWGVDTPPEQIVQPGPYRIERYTTSQRVVLRPNPYYWKRGSQGEALPHIQRLVIQIVENLDTQLLQFRSGGLDFLGVTPYSYSLLKREEKREKFKVYNGGPALSQNFMTLNLNRGQRNGKPLVNPIKSRWFNTLEFRQAVAYGINRQKLLDNVFQGLGATQNSMLPVQGPYYRSPEEGLPVYNYNLEKAKQLLQDAGFKLNPAGQLLDPEGNRVRFTLITNAENKIRVNMGAQIKQDLAKLGIQVDFQPIAFNSLVEKLTTSLDWESYLLGFGGGSIEPNSGANIWLEDGGLHTFNQKPRPGQPPITGRVVSDWERQISDLYIQGAQELDEAKRKAIYAQAQIIAQKNLPFIYLINPLSLQAVRDRVEGVRFSALGGALWNVDELKLAQ